MTNTLVRQGAEAALQWLEGSHPKHTREEVVEMLHKGLDYEDYWDAQIKTLMEEIGHPESNSVYAAMKRFQMRIESYEVKL